MVVVSRKNPASKLEFTSGGERWVIRPNAITDAQALVDAIAESLQELQAFMPFAHFPHTLESQRTRLAQCVAAYWTGKDYGMVVTKPSGEIVACTGLHARAENERALEIGYWVRTAHAGKGLATGIAKALTVYGFEYLGLERIQCGYDRANEGSRRVCAKAGFKIEGTLRAFLPLGDPAWREQGWRGTGDLVLCGVTREDLGDLPWYQSVKADLVVWNGSERVK